MAAIDDILARLRAMQADIGSLRSDVDAIGTRLAMIETTRRLGPRGHVIEPVEATTDAGGFRAWLVEMNLTQAGAARLLGVDPRTTRRWAAGTLAIPAAAGLAMRLMRRYGVTPEQVAAIAREPLADPPAGDGAKNGDEHEMAQAS